MYLLAIIFLTSSCQQNQQSNSEIGQIYNQKINQITSNDVDENLKKQLNEYNNALYGNNSNPRRVLNFIYSDVFTYLKDQNPNNYSEEMVISLLNEPVLQLKKMAKENNLKYKMRVGDIVQRVSEGYKLIYKVEIYLDMEYGMEKHTTGDKILGVSLDNGKNWKFLEITPETTPVILRMKFSNNTISKIM